MKWAECNQRSTLKTFQVCTSLYFSFPSLRIRLTVTAHKHTVHQGKEGLSARLKDTATWRRSKLGIEQPTTLPHELQPLS